MGRDADRHGTPAPIHNQARINDLPQSRLGELPPWN